jgi:hypothetical protein
MPKGQSADVMRYWFPPDNKGPVNSDLIVLPRSGRNPVLGHLFRHHHAGVVAAGHHPRRARLPAPHPRERGRDSAVQELAAQV